MLLLLWKKVKRGFKSGRNVFIADLDQNFSRNFLQILTQRGTFNLELIWHIQLRINLALAKADLILVYVVGTVKLAVQKKGKIWSLCTMAI